jgi:hypothetical protein
VWEKIRNLFRIFLGNCGGSVEKRAIIISLSLPPAYRGSKSNVHPTFGISNGQRKHERNEWQGKVLVGD